MRGTRRLSLWLRALTSRSAVEAELDEELRFHLDMETEKLRRAGFPTAEARRRARLAFGGVERHKEAMRDGRGVRGLERVGQDLRVALRQLRRTPGFTVAAVLTLALGIGANTAVFGVVHGVLLRPLPYPDADRLVSIGHRTRGGDLPETIPNSSAAHVVYSEGSRRFAALAIYEPGQAALTGDDAAPAWVDAVWATRSLFDVLGVSPALGRVFTAEEDRPGGARVAVLSHGLWRERFGADSAVLGRTVTLNGVSWQVIGVMPAGFRFPTRAAQLWLPLRLDRTDLGGFNIAGIGRLRPGVSTGEAERELATLLPRVTTLVDFLSADLLRDAGVRPVVRPYADEVVGGAGRALWALWAMIGLVLVIACVNVASLVLVRAEARRREVTLRVALGAGRAHLLAQFLAESVALLLAGAVLGLAFARLALWLLPRLAPATLPRLEDVALDGTVLAATALTTAVVALVLGVIPVLRYRNAASSEVLRGGDRGATADRRAGRLRQLLVVSQVAMATVLLVGSGLTLRSFQSLRAVDPGFRPERVVTFRIPLPAARYDTPQAVARFHDRLLDRVRALPGVQAAGATANLPLAGYSSLIDPLRVEGVPVPPGTLPAVVEMRAATPGYFEAMGIPLLEGRLLERADSERRTGAVLVSESVVRKLMAGRAPVGARVAHGLAGMEGERAWSDVVGVVGDVRGVSLDEPPIGAVYYAMVNREGVDMDWLARSMVYAVRSTTPPEALLPAVRRVLRELDPALPLAETRTLDAVVDAASAQLRFTAVGLAAAALVGLFLGAVGLYGVLAYVTAQRTREIGVRIALGATPRSVRLGVLARGLAVSGAGVGVGIAGALALRGAAAPMLYGVSPTDPVTLLLVALVLLGVGAAATWLPARRAARLDPVRALRWE